MQPCYPAVKMKLYCTLCAILVCVVLNAVTLGSIALVDIRKNSLNERFNETMHLYNSNPSRKYIVDWIQLRYHCCGYSSYQDWFRFKWQVVGIIFSYTLIFFFQTLAKRSFRKLFCSSQNMNPYRAVFGFIWG